MTFEEWYAKQTGWNEAEGWSDEMHMMEQAWDYQQAKNAELTEKAKAVVDDAELNGGGCGPFYGVNCKKLEALAALTQENK